MRDAQDRFNAGMGADGDASPYPMLRELRAKAAVHPGYPDAPDPYIAGMFFRSPPRPDVIWG